MHPACQINAVLLRAVRLSISTTPAMKTFRIQATMDDEFLEVLDEVPIEFEIVPVAIDMLVGVRFRDEYPI